MDSSADSGFVYSEDVANETEKYRKQKTSKQSKLQAVLRVHDLVGFGAQSQA